MSTSPTRSRTPTFSFAELFTRLHTPGAPQISQKTHFSQRAARIYQVIERVADLFDGHLVARAGVFGGAHDAIGALAHGLDWSVAFVYFKICPPNLIARFARNRALYAHRSVLPGHGARTLLWQTTSAARERTLCYAPLLTRHAHADSARVSGARIGCGSREVDGLPAPVYRSAPVFFHPNASTSRKREWAKISQMPLYHLCQVMTPPRPHGRWKTNQPSFQTSRLKLQGRGWQARTSAEQHRNAAGGAGAAGDGAASSSAPMLGAALAVQHGVALDASVHLAIAVLVEGHLIVERRAPVVASWSGSRPRG